MTWPLSVNIILLQIVQTLIPSFLIGERGALYAYPPDEKNNANVAYKPYGTWATQGEWTYDLPSGVKAVGLAAGGPPPRKSLRSKADADIQGNGNVVIATTDNDLTFLNGGGVERFMMGLHGEFVSMVAGPEWVFVVYRDGATTMDGSQNLRATLIEFETFTVLQDKRLCIKKGHKLKWIGITEDGVCIQCPNSVATKTDIPWAVSSNIRLWWAFARSPSFPNSYEGHLGACAGYQQAGQATGEGRIVLASRYIWR